MKAIRPKGPWQTWPSYQPGMGVVVHFLYSDKLNFTESLVKTDSDSFDCVFFFTFVHLFDNIFFVFIGIPTPRPT